MNVKVRKNFIFFLLPVLLVSLVLSQSAFAETTIIHNHIQASGTSGVTDKYIGQDFAVPAGKYVSKIGFNFTAGDTRAIRIGVYNDDNVPNVLLYDIGLVSPVTGWNNFTTNFQVPASGFVRVLFIENATGVNTMQFDASGVEPLSGGGFSALNPTPATITTPNGIAYNAWMSLTYQNTQPTTITLSPTSGNPGSTVTVNGLGFGAGNTTRIYFDGSLVAQIVHAGTSWTQTFTVPNALVGAHTVNATDTTGSPPKSATATFTVTNNPKLVLSPTSQQVGSSVSASGSGFATNSALTFKMNSYTIPTNPAVPHTNNLGNFTGVTFLVPQTTPGHHNIKVIDTYTNNATAVLNVTSTENISPSSGPVGTYVTVNGFGFLPNHSVTIKYDLSTLKTVTTNGNGTFLNAIIRVPASTFQGHTIKSDDGSHIATATFTVIPALTLTPSGGKIGQVVTINGTGYTATSHITVYFNGNGIINTNPAFFTSDATGSFSGETFVVPNVPPGSYTVQAVDAQSNIGQQQFTVTVANSNAPDPVTDLHTTFINQTKIGLAWTQPNLHNNILVGYQINYTTPTGTPNNILVNNTNSAVTSYTVSNLQANTPYSFRIGVWTTNSSNPYGNILNVQTPQTPTSFTPQNYTFGAVGKTSGTSLNATNPIKIPIAFQRSDFGNNTNILIIYQNNFNLTCSMFFEFAQVTKTYSNIPSVPYDSGFQQSQFQFTNSTNDVIQIDCKDVNSGYDAKYVVTEANFPLIQQTKNFRNGTYGTHGTFGAIDLISLVAVILSMIGLNRISESVGAVFSLIIIGVLGFFQIMSLPSVIISVTALIIMLAVASTRKN